MQSVPPPPDITLPPGYTWFRKTQWLLLRTAPVQGDGIQTHDSNNSSEDGHDDWYQPYPIDPVYDRGFRSHWIENAIDFADFPPRAAGLSPTASVKYEEPHQTSARDLSSR
jgi:hypothetical protein